MKTEPKTKLGRRDFLRALGAGAGVAVATGAPLASQAGARRWLQGRRPQGRICARMNGDRSRRLGCQWTLQDCCDALGVLFSLSARLSLPYFDG